MKIINIVGARPNFMKVAPIHRVMEASNKIDPILLHTGQHYDKDMSKVFFEDLGMPNPNIYLGIGSGSHAVQTARIMVEFEKILLDLRPDLILVVGDVNSTLACALVAVKLNIPVIHVESGLRSFDNTMPEEINRKITDSISEYLFVSEKSGINNLLNENIDKNKIHFVGNVMIDSLVYHLETAKKSKILEENGIDSDFILTTIQRPSNVDCIDNLREVINTLERLF